MKVLRISHSAVVASWRAREAALRASGLTVRLLCARTWDVGGAPADLNATPGEDVVGVRTLGRHPALFVYHPRPLWRALGEEWDVLDVHEEPFALATAEVLALRWLRARLPGGRRPAPYVLYSAQNIAKRYPWPFRTLERRALRGASGISVCNEGARHVLRGKGATCPIETVPLGVDTDVFAPRPGARPDGHGPRDLHATVVGRLEEHKGVDIAIRAVLADPTLRLSVAGDGSAAERLRDLAAPAGERIRFLGPLPPSELATLYRDSDVLVVPSRATSSWVEQFGRVAVEAMACGTPVIAAATGALPDVVGRAGLLVPPDDPEALGVALRRLIDEPELSVRLQEAGAQRVATCTWQAVAARYLDLYDEARRFTATPISTAHAPSGADRPSREPAEIVLVAYGAPELVRTALEPLAGKHPVTVVDNTSLPAIRAIAERLGAHYLDPGRNLGFAAGVNLALADRQSPDADVLLLNPDAVTTPESVDAMAAVLRDDPDVASVGPVQVDGTGRPARVEWPFPSPARSWANALGLGRVIGPGHHGTFVIGSVLLLSRDALTEIGSLDERFFLYAEETDWAFRATRAEWRHVVAERASATHLGGATSSSPTLREAFFYRSQERYVRKHFGPVGWQVERAAQLTGSIVRTALLRGERGAAARRRVRIYLRGPERHAMRTRARREDPA